MGLSVRLRLVAGIGLALAFTGCFTKKPVPVPEPPKPLAYRLQLKGAPSLNPDDAGQALSVVVRVYHLKSTKALAKVGFEQVAGSTSDEEILAGEVLGRRELTVVPGESIPVEDKLPLEATHVAVLALFRRPDPHFWRVVIPAASLKASSTMELAVEPCHLAFLPKVMELLPGQPAEYVPQCPKPVAQTEQAPAEESALAPPKSQGGGMRPRTSGSTRRSRRTL